MFLVQCKWKSLPRIYSYLFIFYQNGNNVNKPRNSFHGIFWAKISKCLFVYSVYFASRNWCSMKMTEKKNNSSKQEIIYGRVRYVLITRKFVGGVANNLSKALESSSTGMPFQHIHKLIRNVVCPMKTYSNGFVEVLHAIAIAALVWKWKYHWICAAFFWLSSPLCRSMFTQF